MKSNSLFVLSKCVLTFFITLSMIVTAVPHSHARVTSAALMEEVQLIKGDLQTIPVLGLKRVSVTDPEIADIADANEEEVLLLAKEPGQTVMFIWEGDSKRTIVVRVIEEDLGLLAERVRSLLVNAGVGRGIKIRMSSLEGKIVLSGAVPEKDMEVVEDVLSPFSSQMINLLREEQIEDLIQIDMQITELSTTLQKAMGVRWSSSTSSLPSLQYSETIPDLGGSVDDLFKVGDITRTSQIISTIDALLVDGKAEVLSKPKIVVANGKEASLLVGGEIPIRTTTSNATGGSVQEDVEFKEYGVNLIITPTIRKGKVDLLLNVEISDIDQANADLTDDVAFTTRTAQTQLFLEDKQTIVLAGLIKKSEGEINRRVPFFSSIPVLGALFRHRSNITPDQDTEVVISITPTILSDKPAAGFESETDEPVIVVGDHDSLSMKSSSMMMDEPSTTSMLDMDMVEMEVRDGLVRPEYGDMPLVGKAVQVGTAVPAIMGPYVKDVQRKISEAISYPYEAQKNGWEGTVKVTLRILRNGTLDDVVLKETSGYAIFDQDALNTARILSPYNAFPQDLNLEEIVVTVPIVYSLNSFLENVVQ